MRDSMCGLASPNCMLKHDRGLQLFGKPWHGHVARRNNPFITACAICLCSHYTGATSGSLAITLLAKSVICGALLQP